jgi:hypothetical protein
MGTQHGIIKLSGSIDNLTFYRAYGRDLVRKKGGPDRQQIMSNPSFQRTRENIAEFGGCSKIAKAMRTALMQVKKLTDGQFGNRLTKVFKLVSLEGEGERGQRMISLSMHRKMFVNFEGNIARKLSDVLPGKITANHNDQRNKATIVFPAGQYKPVKAPEGATHFRLVQMLGLVADHTYDTITKTYIPVDKEHNAKGMITYSGYLSLEEENIPPVTLQTELITTSPLTDRVSVIQAVGISFYQQLGSVYYPLQQGQALKIVDMF